MLFACSIPKATNTPSVYVTLIAFPRQKYLLERPSTLRYTSIASVLIKQKQNQYGWIRLHEFQHVILFSYSAILIQLFASVIQKLQQNEGRHRHLQGRRLSISIDIERFFSSDNLLGWSLETYTYFADTSVCSGDAIALRLWVGRAGHRIPMGSEDLFYSQTLSDWLWGPPLLFCKQYRGYSQKWSGGGVIFSRV
jgi:hypothetical protein